MKNVDIKLTSPQWVDTLSCQHSLGAVNDTLVWLVKSSLLDHLILVLDQQLYSLDWGCGSLGDTSGHS